MALPAALKKKPKTLEESQEFYFDWESNDLIKEMKPEEKKEMKLAFWNAKKIKAKKDKNLTESEIARIDDLFHDCKGYELTTWQDGVWVKTEEEKYKGWTDSDNPKDPRTEVNSPWSQSGSGDMGPEYSRNL